MTQPICLCLCVWMCIVHARITPWPCTCGRAGKTTACPTITPTRRWVWTVDLWTSCGYPTPSSSTPNLLGSTMSLWRTSWSACSQMESFYTAAGMRTLSIVFASHTQTVRQHNKGGRKHFIYPWCGSLYLYVRKSMLILFFFKAVKTLEIWEQRHLLFAAFGIENPSWSIPWSESKYLLWGDFRSLQKSGICSDVTVQRDVGWGGIWKGEGKMDQGESSQKLKWYCQYVCRIHDILNKTIRRL